jgi:hypothetical protein
MIRPQNNFTILLFILFAAAAVSAQVKKTPRPGTTSPAITATPKPTPEPTPEKKNGRPDTVGKPAEIPQSGFKPTHIFKFERPGFLTSKIVIQHDESGKGTIAFLKKDFDEMMTDPIQLSEATIDGIRQAFERLNFLDSTEIYQYEKELANMGSNEITLRLNGRERTVKYNWTDNKDAKFLMDEYRRIANEYVWKFDMVVTRENQPLEAPRMIDALDSYLRRGEISDPPHLLPFIKEISEDERLPLIARNHAARLLKQIEKSKKSKNP